MRSVSAQYISRDQHAAVFSFESYGYSPTRAETGGTESILEVFPVKQIVGTVEEDTRPTISDRTFSPSHVALMYLAFSYSGNKSRNQKDSLETASPIENFTASVKIGPSKTKE